MIDLKLSSSQLLFESKFKSFSHTFNESLCKVPYTNTYYSTIAQVSWESWQASEQREGHKLVPINPTEDQWGGLARHLSRYMQMKDRYCPESLYKYFKRFIGEPPEWLTKEVGDWSSTHAFATADLPVFIYKAMLFDLKN